MDPNPDTLCFIPIYNTQLRLVKKTKRSFLITICRQKNSLQQPMDTDQGMRRTMLEKKTTKSRLILFPLPFQGHINPMIQLANILHSTGKFTISIIHTRFNSPDPSKYPHFTFHPISDPLSGLHQPNPDPSMMIKLLNTNCVEPFRECVVRLLSDVDHPVKCLVSDANWYSTQSVADGLKLPRIVMRTSSVCALLAYTALPLLRERGYLSHKGNKWYRYIWDLFFESSYIRDP